MNMHDHVFVKIETTLSHVNKCAVFLELARSQLSGLVWSAS